MYKTTTIEILFFLSIFLIFFISSKAIWYLISNKTIPVGNDLIMLLVGIIYTMVIMGVYYISNLNRRYKQNYKHTKQKFQNKNSSDDNIRGYVSDADYKVGGNKRPSRMFNLSSAKRCLGGSYMNQGDSKDAKFCQDFIKTSEGRQQISRHTCGGCNTCNSGNCVGSSCDGGTCDTTPGMFSNGYPSMCE
jgi:hypothetical protein